MSKIIPEATKLAAKRGFVRTTSQAYSTALAGGISATALLAIVAGEVQLVPTLITWGVAAVSPVIAGLASYLDITARGIPGDYTDAVLAQQAVLDPDEQEADVQAAISRARG